MYTQHFGLEKAVFDGGIAQHDDLFLSTHLQRAAANLKIGLTTRDAIVTLTGPLGVGKTTLAAHTLSITSTRLAQSWVGHASLTPDETIEAILAEFDLAPYRMGRVQRLQTWRQFVSEMGATDTRICILVENAAELGVEGLRALEALTAAQPNDCPGASLILMGSTLAALLEEPGLSRLRQRIRSRQRLEPMTAEEVEQYLKFRVTVAGGDYDAIFAPGTAAMVHRCSAGIPRLINNVSETSLVVAAMRNARQVTPDTVRRVAETAYGLAPSANAATAPVAKLPERRGAPDAAAREPADKPAPATAPAPVAATAAAATVVPVAAPVAAPATEPATEPAAAPAAKPAAAPTAAVQSPAQKPVPTAKPAPITTADAADSKDAEALQVSAILDPTDSAGHFPEPPVLTDAVMNDDIEIAPQESGKNVAKSAQPPVATFAPDAPALPEAEQEPDEDFSEDFAAATHLHEISDEMAELLFSADPATSATGMFKAAKPLDPSELDLESPASTAIFRQLDEDALPDDDDADPPVRAASTFVY